MEGAATRDAALFHEQFPPFHGPLVVARPGLGQIPSISSSPHLPSPSFWMHARHARTRRKQVERSVKRSLLPLRTSGTVGLSHLAALPRARSPPSHEFPCPTFGRHHENRPPRH